MLEGMKGLLIVCRSCQESRMLMTAEDEKLMTMDVDVDV